MSINQKKKVTKVTFYVEIPYGDGKYDEGDEHDSDYRAWDAEARLAMALSAAGVVARVTPFDTSDDEGHYWMAVNRVGEWQTA
jgi:hypothetical protein